MSLNRTNSSITHIYLIAEKNHIITPNYGQPWLGFTYFLELDGLIDHYQNAKNFYAIKYVIPDSLKEKILTSPCPFKDSPTSRAATNDLTAPILFDSNNFEGYWEILINKKTNEITKSFTTRDTLVGKILATHI